MPSLSTLLKYTLDGTLCFRARRRIARSTPASRQTWWNRDHGTAQSFRHRLIEGPQLHLHFDSRLAQAIYCHDFEIAERTFVSRCLKPADTFADVGANIGLFTLIAARRVGTCGRVLSFEPCSQTFSRLRQNIQLNHLQNVQCHQLALSDSQGSARLSLASGGHDAWNSLGRPTAGEPAAHENVTTTTWDLFAERHALIGRVSLMKIDVEGWEEFVLKGARRTLQGTDAPDLLIEFADATAANAGSSSAAVYSLLASHGYKLYTYDSANNALIPSPLKQEYTYDNLIATKDASKITTKLNT